MEKKHEEDPCAHERELHDRGGQRVFQVPGAQYKAEGDRHPAAVVCHRQPPFRRRGGKETAGRREKQKKQAAVPHHPDVDIDWDSGHRAAVHHGGGA